MPLLTDPQRLEILKLLQAKPQISQRDLAQAMGVSLGKANIDSAYTAVGRLGDLSYRDFGIGAEPDFIGRDVKGKAVIIYSTFVPGGRSHSASDRASGVLGGACTNGHSSSAMRR